MGRPKSFVFDLGEGYPTFTLYYDCHGHGVSQGPRLCSEHMRNMRRAKDAIAAAAMMTTTMAVTNGDDEDNENTLDDNVNCNDDATN